MSPIRIETIEVQTYTETRTGLIRKPGWMNRQVIALGDSETPGVYVYIGNVKPKNVQHIKQSGKNIVDVGIDLSTGQLSGTHRGIWRWICDEDDLQE